MKRFLLPVVIVFGMTLPAAAGTLDVLYENTLTFTDTQARTTTVLVSEGGKLEQVNAAGMWAAGFWSEEGDRFCWTPRGASKMCIPLPADKGVGDGWDISGPTGKLVWKAEIVAGRADLQALSDNASHGGH